MAAAVVAAAVGILDVGPAQARYLRGVEATRGPAQQGGDAAPSAAAVRALPAGLMKQHHDVLLNYVECPAKCLVQLLEHYYPRAGIGAWCRRADPIRFLCVSVVDDRQAQARDCRSWLLRKDTVDGVRLLGQKPTACQGRANRPGLRMMTE